MSSSISTNTILNLEFNYEDEIEKLALRTLADGYIETKDIKIFHGFIGLWCVKRNKDMYSFNDQMKIMNNMNENEMLSYANFILDKVT